MISLRIVCSFAFLQFALASQYEGTSVSVCGDATYMVEGPVCLGSTDNAPYGTNCPNEGDVAVANCNQYLATWNPYEHECIAKEDAECVKLTTGAWGCVFPSVHCGVYNPCTPTPEPTTPCPTTPEPTTPCPTTPEPTTPCPTTPEPTTPCPTTPEPTTPCPTTSYPSTCKRPLYYEGCALDSVHCGDFAGFQLYCHTEGNPDGQCLCSPYDDMCIMAVQQHNVSAMPGYLPQFGTNCNLAKGCYGSGQLCNSNGEHGDCKECEEPVECIENKDHFWQCHSCSSCLEQNGLFNCDHICN